MVHIYFWQNEYNLYFYYLLNYAEVALTGCPFTFLADFSWAGVDSAPLFERTLNNYITLLFTFFQGIVCNRPNLQSRAYCIK